MQPKATDPGLTPNRTSAAINALTGGQEVFDRAQVAYLLAVAFDLGSGIADREAFEQGRREGYQQAIDACRRKLADPATDDSTVSVFTRHLAYEIGYGVANDEMVAALTMALGGPEAKNYRDAVDRHLRATSSLAARRAWDAETRRLIAAGPQPGDYTGGPIPWDIDRLPQQHRATARAVHSRPPEQQRAAA